MKKNKLLDDLLATQIKRDEQAIFEDLSEKFSDNFQNFQILSIVA